jgi:hypothetical protein
MILLLACVSVGWARTFELSVLSGFGSVGAASEFCGMCDPTDHIPIGLQALIGLFPGSFLLLGIEGKHHGLTVGEEHDTQSTVGAFVRFVTGEPYPRFYIRGGMGSYVGAKVYEVMETDTEGNEIGRHEHRLDYDGATGVNLGIGWMLGTSRESRELVAWEFNYHRIFDRKLSGSKDLADVHSWTLRLLLGLRFEDV